MMREFNFLVWMIILTLAVAIVGLVFALDADQDCFRCNLTVKNGDSLVAQSNTGQFLGQGLQTGFIILTSVTAANTCLWSTPSDTGIEVLRAGVYNLGYLTHLQNTGALPNSSSSSNVSLFLAVNGVPIVGSTTVWQTVNTGGVNTLTSTISEHVPLPAGAIISLNYLQAAGGAMSTYVDTVTGSGVSTTLIIDHIVPLERRCNQKDCCSSIFGLW